MLLTQKADSPCGLGLERTHELQPFEEGKNDGSLIMQTPTQGMPGSWRDSQEDT